MFHIRSYRPDKLEGVMGVECSAFPGEQYPPPVFVQFHELFPNTFFVAESDAGVLGYIVAASSPDAPTKALILSMAVVPEEQGKGIGRALLKKVLHVMAQSGIADVELTVSPENQPAFSLYQSMGFEEKGSLLKNLFGPGRHRIRMTKHVETGYTAKDDHLLAEASASLAFTNLLVAISGAGLGGLIAVKSTNAIAYWYVIVALLGSLYSSMFYANVSGIVARLRGTRDPIRPLIIGNTLSEYLGVYPMVLAFPLVVLALSQSPIAAGLAALANGLIFALYQLSNFDIFGRHAPRWSSWVTLFLIVATAIAHVWVQLFGRDLIQYAIGATSTLVLIVLTVHGIMADER